MEESTNICEYTCRFCLESDGDFTNPCYCAGSMKTVHKECLIKWISIAKIQLEEMPKCEICHELYNVKIDTKLKFNPKEAIKKRSDILIIFLGIIFVISILLILLLCTIYSKQFGLSNDEAKKNVKIGFDILFFFLCLIAVILLPGILFLKQKNISIVSTRIIT